MIRKLAIFGGGGHGKVAASVALSLGYDVSFFDDAFPAVVHCGRWDLIGNLECLKSSLNDFCGAFVAIGNNSVRQRIFSELEGTGFNMINLIAQSAVVDPSVNLGRGLLVVGNAAINIDSKIGDGVIINTNAIIEHDCTIAPFAHICPNVALAGEVSIGSQSWIGIGSSIIQQKVVGNNVIIGAGSTVINDIPDNVTAVGVPARILY